MRPVDGTELHSGVRWLATDGSKVQPRPAEHNPGKRSRPVHHEEGGGGGGSLVFALGGPFRRGDFLPPSGAADGLSEAGASGGDSTTGGTGSGAEGGGGATGASTMGLGATEGAGATGGGGLATGGGVGDGATGAGVGCVGGGDADGAGCVAWWVGCAAAGRGAMGVNSPGFQVCGIRRIDGSFRKRSAWPHARQIRVPRESSPRARSDSEPPPSPPVLRSFAQTKSVAPQLLQTGATRFTLGGPGVRAAI